MDSSSCAVLTEPQSPVADQRSHTYSRSSPVQAHTGSFVVAQGPRARKWCSGMGLLPCRCRPLLPNPQGTDSTSSPPAENGAQGCLERAQTQQDNRARDTKPSHAKRQMFLGALGSQRPEVQSLGPGKHTAAVTSPFTGEGTEAQTLEPSRVAWQAAKGSGPRSNSRIWALRTPYFENTLLGC